MHPKVTERNVITVHSLPFRVCIVYFGLHRALSWIIDDFIIVQLASPAVDLSLK